MIVFFVFVMFFFFFKSFSRFFVLTFGFFLDFLDFLWGFLEFWECLESGILPKARTRVGSILDVLEFVNFLELGIWNIPKNHLDFFWNFWNLEAHHNPTTSFSF